MLPNDPNCRIRQNLNQSTIEFHNFTDEILPESYYSSLQYNNKYKSTCTTKKPSSLTTGLPRVSYKYSK